MACAVQEKCNRTCAASVLYYMELPYEIGILFPLNGDIGQGAGLRFDKVVHAEEK